MPACPGRTGQGAGEGHEVAQRETCYFRFPLDLPLFFVLSIVTFVSLVVEALNKVINKN
jgi:hypothetical protein